MAISGSQRSLQFALGGVARGGAFRAGVVPPKLYVSVGGIHRAYGQSGTSYRVRDLTVDDMLGEVPNTCRFMAIGFTPTVGMDVIITLGSKNSLTREFGGQIVNLDQTYLAEKPANQAWNVSAIDYTWGLGKRKVAKKYTSTTIAVIAGDLIASYASGYTVTVEAAFGATTIDEFSATNDDLPDVLSRLVARGGGYWLCDYFKVVRLFTSDTSSTAPTQLTAAHPTMRDLQVSRDLSQMITRVYFEGMGSQTTNDAGVGATTIRLADLTAFQTTGGTVVSGPQRITYSGLGYGDAASAPWTAQVPASSSTWIDVVWADTLGLFVAVGDGVVMTSSDATVWTSRTAAEANLWTAVTWASSLGLLVAVAGTGSHRVMTSSDGITWTARTASASELWIDVIWAAGLSLFVATSTNSSGTVMTSPDGITWTTRTPAAPDSWQAVAWSPALSLLAAVNGQSSSVNTAIMTSPDGIAWTGRTATKNAWVDIAWSPSLGLFAAISNIAQIMTSPDGITWTVRTTPSAATFAYHILWAPELALFIAPGVTGTSNAANAVLTSPDGVTWTIGSTLPNGGWRGLAWSSTLGRVVVVGDTVASKTNTVATSGYTALRGVPASGAGSVLYSINSGDDVNLLVQVDDVSAQTTLAGLIGGDGIQETYVQDRRVSYLEATARASALLAQRGVVDTELRFTTRDLNAKSGRTQSVNVAAPMSVTGSFIIQQSTLTAFPRSSDFVTAAAKIEPTAYPPRTVHASSNRFTFEDLLRQGRRDTT